MPRYHFVEIRLEDFIPDNPQRAEPFEGAAADMPGPIVPRDHLFAPEAHRHLIFENATRGRRGGANRSEGELRQRRTKLPPPTRLLNAVALRPSSISRRAGDAGGCRLCGRAIRIERKNAGGSEAPGEAKAVFSAHVYETISRCRAAKGVYSEGLLAT